MPMPPPSSDQQPFLVAKSMDVNHSLIETPLRPMENKAILFWIALLFLMTHVTQHGITITLCINILR
jgi:hypothetical protein